MTRLCSSVFAFAMGFLLSGLLLHSPYVHAEEADAQALVHQVKAAYLFKFGNYVEWPADAFPSGSSPVVIGVVGDDMIAEELARIALSRGMGKRAVSVKRLQLGDSASGIHMLFIGSSADQPISQWLAPLQGQPVLCVTEAPNGPPPGSVINFVLDDNRVRFDVSLPAAERKGLKLGASLLAVAREVKKDYFE